MNNGGLPTVVKRVQATTSPGEIVCICGSTPQLGEWQVSSALVLEPEEPGSDVWTGRIDVLPHKAVEFRYLIILILDATDGRNEQDVVVRRWETHLHPRVVTSTRLMNDHPPEVDVFGYYNGKECIDSGWLTAESIVQLKLYNNPITIWKRRYRDQPFSIRVCPVDLVRKDNEISDSFMDADQDSTITDIRQATWPLIEIAVMNDTQWKFHRQEQFGHLYDPDEFVVFQAQMLRPETIAFMVDFYTQSTPNPEMDGMPEHFGSCYVLPSNMRGTSGMCTMPITGNRNQPIGQITVEYLIVRPLPGYTCDCSISYARHWKVEKRGLDVGHRGAGNARRTDKVENVLENTVASFNYAARHGADMVELDVQLSKDLVPVIYHDYHILIAMKKKKKQHDHEHLQVAVKDLTAEQLQLLKLSPASAEKHKYDFEEDDYEENQPFPTLKHVLEAVDERVGFNIEIKAPMQLRDGTWELDHHFDFNTYVDIILKTILEYAGPRYIVLSCFHPDICTMVKLKQNKYPLLFLTQGQTEKYPPYLDTRTSSVEMATYFALSAGILGINVHAEDLLRDRMLIGFVKQHSLILFCWGEDINKSTIIKELKKDGVDGVIYDKVDEFTTSQDNVFLVGSKTTKLTLLEITGHSSDSICSWLSTATPSP